MVRKQQKRQILVNGYAYPNINQQVLEGWLPSLTFVTTFSYSITAQGELNPLNDEEVIATAKAVGVEAFMAVTNMDESGEFSSQLAKAFLESPTAQYKLIDNVLATIKAKGLMGANFDFEYIFKENREQYTRFIERATSRLNSQGYVVMVAVAPKLSVDQPGVLYEGHDYKGLGQAANFIILMTYEWGYTFGPPRAVAPVDQVRLVIEYAVTEIDPDKILMGIPNYGYDWTLPFVQGESRAEAISNEEAVARAERYGVEIQFDETAQSPYFNYTDEEGKKHVVWFEDARSIRAKLDLVEEFNLAGVSFWTIMNPFPTGQAVLNEMFEVAKA